MEASLTGPTGQVSLGFTEITIGRIPGNQFVVNDSKVSSRHAEIRPEGDGYTITDLGSTNGTFVNEQRLAPNTPYRLNNGDRVRFGDTTFNYEVRGASPVAPTVYAGSEQGNIPGYQPTVAVDSPYAQNNPAYAPPAAAPPPYTDYGQGAPAVYPPSPPVQGYPAYGAPPVPPAYGPPGAPVLPQQRRNRTLWFILGGVGALVVLVIVLVAALVYANRSTPAKTLDAFCNAIHNRDYQTAYNQLSSFRQTRVSETQFANIFTNFASCTYSSPAESGTSATTNMTFDSPSVGVITAPADLVQENGIWKIDAINFPTQ